MRLTPLKLRRLEAGLLQIEAATRARIPVAKLSQLENGHRIPTDEDLRRLAAALRVSVDLLREAQAA